MNRATGLFTRKWPWIRGGESGRASAIPARSWGIFLVTLVLGVLASQFIPPFQSPDENAHLVRAYLLSEGHLFLTTQSDKANTGGGYIDQGLETFGSIYQGIPGHVDSVVTRDMDQQASAVKWTGKTVFVGAAGTGYYFPIVYAPPALGLRIGKLLDWSVLNSYRLARFLTLLSALSLLALAARIYPPNWLAVAILLTPMSILQLCSPTIDGISTALTFLVASLFLRAYAQDKRFAVWMTALLGVAVAILATSRPNMLPLLLMPFFVWRAQRQKRVALLYPIAIVAFVGIWTLFTVKSNFVVADRSQSTADVIAYYLGHPHALVGAYVDTLTSRAQIFDYFYGFVGVLGWLDTWLPLRFYREFGLALLVLVPLSMVSTRYVKEYRERLLLLAVAILSTFLIFLALLLVWNSAPAATIQGVQGRYFIQPFILLAYAIATPADAGWRWARRAAATVVVVLGLLDAVAVPQTLLSRYFIGAGASGAVVSAPLQNSGQIALPLFPGQSLVGAMPGNVVAGRMRVRSASILIGNYFNSSDGSLEVRICQSNQCTAGAIDLKHTKDNSEAVVRFRGGIDVVPGVPVEFRISHVGGRKPVALWAWKAAAGYAQGIRGPSPGDELGIKLELRGHAE